MALCGGSARKDFCKLNTLPLWIIHGTADKAVPLSQSQRIVDAMKQCGPAHLLRFEKLKGINHSQMAKVFYIPETYEWLFEHKRSERKLHKHVDITVSSLEKAYQNIDRSANKIVVVDNARNVPAPVVNQDTVKVADDTLAKVANEVVPPKAQEQSSTPAAKPTAHIVKKGDTLYAIARKYNTTVEKLCKLNHIKETDILSLGQRIRVR